MTKRHFLGLAACFASLGAFALLLNIVKFYPLWSGITVLCAGMFLHGCVITKMTKWVNQ
jgi:hypothetical protein